MLARALEHAHLFLVAEREGQPVGMLIVIVPAWTDAAEITDLAVDFHSRQTGAGRSLMNAAMKWARERGHRASSNLAPTTPTPSPSTFARLPHLRLQRPPLQQRRRPPRAATVYMHLQRDRRPPCPTT
jgi:GNAT superfamily N-acetyltransferase